MANGLLGLGGFSGIGGAKPPPALLGSNFDPAEMRRQQIKQALLGAGIGLLSNGKGSFGEVLGQGFAGGLQGAQQAGQDYKQNALDYYKLNLDQQDRNRRIGMENTKMGWDIEDRARKDKELTNIMDFAHSQPEEIRKLIEGNPELGAKLYMEYKFKNMFAGPGEAKVVSPGQTVLGPDYKPLYTAPEAPPKPTSGIQDYEYYKQNELKAGRQPLSPLEYEKEVRRSGATTIDMNGADGNFDKELSKGVAGAYIKQMETGQNAVATKTAAQQLRVLMKDRGGALDGLTAVAAPYLPAGIIPEGANDIVAAQAIVSGLIPKQRVPGSGTTSDFDARKFAESLPSMWNKPGANEIITSTMESYADYQIAVSNAIADVASNPEIKNKSAAIREEIAKIPDPFIGWKQYMAASGSSLSVPAQQSGTGKTSLGIPWKVLP